MGIYYEAKLIFGLPYDELATNVEEDDLEELTESLDRASPYYDCDSDDMIFGVSVASTGDYQYEEFTYDQSKVDAAKLKFKKLTGKDGRLFLSPHGA